jgi:6-phosphogluconolactonase (cycloisomerase 2 family)
VDADCRPDPSNGQGPDKKLDKNEMTRNKMIGWKRGAPLVGLGLTVLLTGCAGFFVDPSAGNGLPGSSGGSTGSGGATPSITGDFVYTVNNANSMSGFAVGTSALTSLFTPIGLPYPLSSGSSIAITRDNTLLFVGGNGGLVSYNISSSGTLTAVSGGATVEQANFISMATSPDGKWLLALDNESNVIYVFSIEYTNRIANYQNQYTINIGGTVISSATSPARSLAISPDGTMVAVAVGTSGDEVYSFNTSTGVLTGVTAVPAPGAPYIDDSVAFDGSFNASAGTATASTHLFIGRGLIASGESEIVTYGVNAGTLSGTPTATIGAGQNVDEQNPYQLLVDPTGAYLYSANRASVTSTISAYSLAAATSVLTPLANSPFTSGIQLTALAEDNSKTQLLAAAAGGSPDLTMYTFSTVAGAGGQLTQTTTASNGTTTAGIVALATTH